ncbi:unnamed protein product [Caenorhabditis sp. 36 PRJEB53466]|nr:unnamed protein product [Caenorhabditis sp. 36 PRJEB53466]
MEQSRGKILFQCLAPKHSDVFGKIGTDFQRENQSTTFCHLRFSRPMFVGDNVEIKVTFHELPLADGQCIVSVTPAELLDKKARNITSQNPFSVDPTTSWISRLRDDDYKRSMRFGLIYRNGSVQLRLPGETDFFPFYYVQNDAKEIWIDVFFCEYVKSVSLREPLFPKWPDVLVDVELDDLVDEPVLLDSLLVYHRAKIVVS